MKKFLMLATVAVSLCGCLGFSSTNNEVVGQVKRVFNNNPLICDAYKSADLSLGVIRNGVGSMSTSDMWLYIPNPADAAFLADAANSGAIVKITYDEMRASWCVPESVVTKVELAK